MRGQTGLPTRARLWLDRLHRLLGGLVAALLALLLLLLLAAVVARYGFGAGFVGADELAVWLHVALVSLGLPLVGGSALAMRLDVLAVLLPARLRPGLLILADAYAVAACLVLAFGGATVLGLLGGTSTALMVPEWVRFAPLPAGAALALVESLLRPVAAGRGLGAALAALALGAAAYAATRLLSLDVATTPSLVAGLVAALGLLVGAPLPHSLVLGVAAAIPAGGLLPEPAIAQNVVGGVSRVLLLAIPGFLLAGGLLTAGGLGERLVRCAAALVGHRRGGLAQTALLAGVLFSGASGSSIANAAFGAKAIVPGLVAHGYRPERACAVVAATAVLDNIIPPSIAFLILAAATDLSVGRLLVGGFVAGGLMTAALAVSFHLTADPAAVEGRRAGPAERRSALVGAVPAMGLGVVVVAGIRLGAVTTTEAAALAAAYALLVCLALRSLTLPALGAVLRQAAAESAAVGLLIGASAPFAFLLAVDGVADALTGLVTAAGAGPLAVMLLASLVLLVAGAVLDIGAAILLLGPLLLPAARAAGIDPVAFGVVLVVNLMLHGLTPPLGVLCYVVSGIARVPVAAVFRAVTPHLLALLAALALMSAWVAAMPLLGAPVTP